MSSGCAAGPPVLDGYGVQIRLHMKPYPIAATRLQALTSVQFRAHSRSRSDECRSIAGLYDQAEQFRSTKDMARHWFGSGQYRYLTRPPPARWRRSARPYTPQLLQVARAWAEKLAQPAPWPDTLDAWLAMCQAAGRARPTPFCSATALATGTRRTATCTAI